MLKSVLRSSQNFFEVAVEGRLLVFETVEAADF